MEWIGTYLFGPYRQTGIQTDSSRTRGRLIEILPCAERVNDRRPLFFSCLVQLNYINEPCALCIFPMQAQKCPPRVNRTARAPHRVGAEPEQAHGVGRLVCDIRQLSCRFQTHPPFFLWECSLGLASHRSSRLSLPGVDSEALGAYLYSFAVSLGPLMMCLILTVHFCPIVAPMIVKLFRYPIPRTHLYVPSPAHK